MTAVKILLIAVLSSLITLSQQLSDEVAISATKRIPLGLQAEARGIRSLDEKSLSGSNYEVSLGYILKSNWLVNLNYGKLNKSKTTSGGDLKEWQYVEQGSQFQSDYYMIEVKKLFYNPFVADNIKGFYISAGYGQLEARVDYNYNRYKPYNGFICLIGPCEKALEESDVASTTIKLPFARIGSGYTWELKSPRSLGAISISGGFFYNNFLKKDLISLQGANHEGSFDTSELDKLTFNLGVGTLF